MTTPTTTTTTILVVDDETQMRRTLDVNLRARGYDVKLAPGGRAALEIAARAHPDVVVLDLGLPDLDGIDVVHGLRGWTSVPIVVLSARGREVDKVAALDAGADDYVTKPFGMDELVARLRAVLRRAITNEDESALVETPHFTVDLARRSVHAAHGDIRLTRTQWRLLEILVRNPDRLVTYRQLLQEGWGPEYETETKYVRAFVAQLRAKLEPDPARPRYFLTEAGMGYRFVPAGSHDTTPSLVRSASTSPAAEGSGSGALLLPRARSGDGHMLELVERFKRADRGPDIEACADALASSRDNVAVRPLLERLCESHVNDDPDVEDAVCGALAALGVMEQRGNGLFRVLSPDLLDGATRYAVGDLISTIPARYRAT